MRPTSPQRGDIFPSLTSHLTHFDKTQIKTNIWFYKNSIFNSVPPNQNHFAQTKKEGAKCPHKKHAQNTPLKPDKIRLKQAFKISPYPDISLKIPQYPGVQEN